MIELPARAKTIDWEWVKTDLLKKERFPDKQNAAITQALEKSIESAKKLTTPKALVVIKKISRIEKDFLEIEGNIRFSGKRMISYIKGGSSVGIFLTTVGEKTEKEASLLMAKGESLDGYLLDRIGSIAVESLTESVDRFLRDSYLKKGMSVSMRLSPGYCDWPIEEQFEVEKVLDFSRIGVKLTESCMMIPRKSISAMVGIGPKDALSGAVSQCVVCDKEECDYRR